LRALLPDRPYWLRLVGEMTLSHHVTSVPSSLSLSATAAAEGGDNSNKKHDDNSTKKPDKRIDRVGLADTR